MFRLHFVDISHSHSGKKICRDRRKQCEHLIASDNNKQTAKPQLAQQQQQQQQRLHLQQSLEIANNLQRTFPRFFENCEIKLILRYKSAEKRNADKIFIQVLCVRDVSSSVSAGNHPQKCWRKGKRGQ